jgi:hypothetical protein
MSSRIGGAARCVRWSLRPLDWRRVSYWRRRQARRAFSRDRKTRRPHHRSRHLRRKDGLPCRKLRSDTDSRRRAICLPMSCAGRNWASRPQQSRGSFNRRAFAATANLAVNRGLIADLVQSERPVSLPPPNAPSTSRRQDRRSRRGCHPGKRRSSELAIALSTVARGESVEDRAIGIGPIYEGCELLVSSLALSPSGHIAVSCLS